MLFAELTSMKRLHRLVIPLNGRALSRTGRRFQNLVEDFVTVFQDTSRLRAGMTEIGKHPLEIDYAHAYRFRPAFHCTNGIFELIEWIAMGN
jgi:hypothetical protein